MFLFLTVRDILDYDEIRMYICYALQVKLLAFMYIFPYNNVCYSEVTDTACSLCKRDEVLYIRTFFYFAG